jgi:lipoprotein-releasing system permease protein
MRFEVTLAYRHLRHSPGQSLLTIMTVAVAVTVMIFINSLVLGLQNRILHDQIGSLPHITIKMAERQPTPLYALPGASGFQGASIEKQAIQRIDIQQPDLLEEQVMTFPGVTTAVAAVRGQAFVIRGEKRYGVTVSGSLPYRYERVVSLQEHMIAGRWLDITSEEVVLGFRLADDLGIKVGDRIRLVSSEGVSQTFLLAGMYDTGLNSMDQGQVFVTLRAAQDLFATGRDVSSINVKLARPFEANAIADRMTQSLGYKCESWMREQAQIVNAFNAQNSSRLMISGFSLLASAFGIASVLIVSVLQKSKQIGILKSIGARDSQLMLVFTLEGLIIALLGATLGAGLGSVLLKFLMGIKQVARFGKANTLFPITFETSVFVGAMGAAVLATLVASIIPAWRAARMNPVDVIRGG